MKYLMLDLEWNAAYSKRLGRYINEIIEFGAVILNENLEETHSFKGIVRSQLTKKLSGRFKDLTHISNEEMSEGSPFGKVLKQFTAFAKAADVIMTWSNTDLYVLLDNCKSFTDYETIPFLRFYMDLQPFVQKKLKTESKNQIALGAAAEALGLDTSGYSLHRAVDDSRVCAELLRKTYEKEALERLIINVDETRFYERLLFKAHYIRDIKSKDIDRRHLRMQCDNCGAPGKRQTPWKNRSQGFSADFLCGECGRNFRALVRFKKTWDGILVRKSIKDIPKEENKTEENEPLSAEN